MLQLIKQQINTSVSNKVGISAFITYISFLRACIDSDVLISAWTQMSLSGTSKPITIYLIFKYVCHLTPIATISLFSFNEKSTRKDWQRILGKIQLAYLR